jgi:hypothetical protein
LPNAEPSSCAPGKFGFCPACERLAGFAADSLLEGTGFELLVPRREARDFVRQGGQARAPYTPYSLENVHDRGGDGIGADHVAGKGNRTRPDLH